MTLLLDNRIKDRSLLRSKTIMLQLWAESPKPLVPEQVRKLQRLFDSFRFAVLEEFLRSTGGEELPVVAEFTAMTGEGNQR